MRDELSIRLPAWLTSFVKQDAGPFPTVEERMAFVISIAERNILHKTGGPFGAAVFDSDGNCVSVGANLVELNNCSILHAEMVAIAFAQQRLSRYDLSNGGVEALQLVTSVEPCAMCFGAIPWAGLSSVVCGARDEDARAVGFDEGPKLPDWKRAYQERGIAVQCDVLRDKAAAVLKRYVELGGVIYNGHRDAEAWPAAPFVE